MKTPLCRRCNVPMRSGLALVNTLTSFADFPGDRPDDFLPGQTISRSGAAVSIEAWKCPSCGHSMTAAEPPPTRDRAIEELRG